MMKSIWTKDTVLFDKTAKLNNFIKPYNGYVIKGPVQGDKFPEQDSDKLLTRVTIYYRDRQDCEFGTSIGMDFEYHIRHIDATVLRWDLSEPYMFIGMDTLGRMFIGNTLEPFEDQTMLYGTQQYNHYNEITVNAYRDLRTERIGLCMRCDDNEPSYAVFLEYLDNYQIRFVMNDEIFAKVLTDLEKQKYEDYYGISIDDYPKLRYFDIGYDSEKTMLKFLEELFNEKGYTLYGKVSDNRQRF